jgi:PHS family inorganic phosphate transporter-like MFS transporter
MSNNPFKNMDSLKLTFNHIKVWYTAGMGFFTDAYDLLIISYILATFVDAYKYLGMSMLGFTNYLVGPNSAYWTGLLASSAIITAVIGELIFGFLGDKLGRKTVYGIEASLLTIGALLSAFAWNLPSLIFFRSIMGIGIGGDYPISATIMSEYANVKDRGKLIALVFANQGLGSIAALAVGVISATILPPDIAWRVMAGVGAIPAATVIYLRRKVPETPRYSLLVKGNTEEAKKAAKFLGTDIEANSNVRSGHKGVNEFLSTYLPVLIGTAGSWFIVDIALYGTGVYSSSALAPVFGSPFPSHATTLSLGEFQSDLAKALFLGGVPFLAGLPGYFTAVALLDKLGRKWIQLQGFIAMAIIYVVVASVMVVKGTKVEGFTIAPTLAFIIYSLSFYFIDFGANTTTFVIPAEVYPTKFRTTGHGISAASGKFGAAITTYLFPSLLAAIGIKEILIMLAILSVIGAILTYALIPEPKLKPLEEASREKLEVSQ